ncbi:MAG: formylglycine-generating enzyme family protein [Deltaproteobacteria bacterium]
MDTIELVDRYATCRPIDPIPRERVRHLEGRVWVLVDDTSDARPFAADYEVILDGLVRAFGHERVVVEYLPDGPCGLTAQAVAAVASSPDRFLALAEPRRRSPWSALGRSLARHRTPTLMLSLGRRRVPPPWRSVSDVETVSHEEVTAVLELMSFAVVFDAVGLRAATSERSTAVECAAWHDTRVRHTITGRARIGNKARAALRAGFLARDVGVRRAAVERLAASATAAQVWVETYLGLLAMGQAHLVPEDARRAAHLHLEKLTRALETGTFGATDRDRALAWYEHLDERKGEIDFEADEAMGRWVRRLQHLVDGRRVSGVPASATHRLYVRGGFLTSLGSVLDSPIDLRATRSKLRVERLAPAWASRGGNDQFGRWASFEVAGVEQVMRWIPGGTFLMGSPEDEEERHEGETQHEVTLSEGYWLAETPCTQALWSAVMNDEPSGFKGPQRPVEQVSFDDVQVFLATLNAQVPGLDLVLPTEAQWERACRAGSAEAPYGPLGAVAWYAENSEGETHDVKTREPNAWGLHDMLGNVREWCADGAKGWGEPDPYPDGPVTDPLAEPGERPYRVMRGGSWLDFARSVRAAFRYAFHRDDRLEHVGFRLARGRAQSSPGPAEPASSSSSAGPRGTRETEPHVIRSVRLDADTRIPIDLRAPVRLETDLVSLDLEPFERPEWASGVGRDRFGLFADVEVETRVVPEVIRMRWIPPGRFMMGSPEDEPGRFNREKQHQVTLTQGYWLAETPCTQALYEAVLGKEANPSRFRTRDRPVENVSWDDAVAFMAALNRQHVELALRLPTEAEWEYACRAGTTAATYGGPIEILGDRNAPALDAIALYGGNSGQGYDLEEGHDTSDWGEMQYPTPKAGTRAVRTKIPNPWGLYDMLGNIWEWCADGADGRPDPYPDAPVTDPLAEPGERPSRVSRGGSWVGSARYVRAAYRRASHRDFRHAGVGFRLARGRAPGGGVPVAEPPSPEGLRKNSRG